LDAFDAGKIQNTIQINTTEQKAIKTEFVVIIAVINLFIIATIPKLNKIHKNQATKLIIKDSIKN
jgi:hypothetical protein